MTMHYLATIRQTMPWAPLPRDLSYAPIQPFPEHATWNLNGNVWVTYSGDTDWATVRLAHGTTRLELHYTPHNTDHWSASHYNYPCDEIPLVTAATPADAMAAALGSATLHPALAVRVRQLVQHATKAAP